MAYENSIHMGAIQETILVINFMCAMAGKRRAVLFASILIATLAGSAIADTPKQELIFTSWGGSYAHAQAKMAVAPFTASTGVPVRMAEYDGGLVQLRKQHAAGKIEWDIVDMSLADALAACDEGLIEKIDPENLAPGTNGERPRQDFISGALTDCFAGTNVWSTVFVYNRNKYPRRAPASVSDIFDLAQFPGKRALQKSPQGNVEWALIADGVPLDKVYAVMSTPTGLERAFRKLDSIKDHVVWWEDGSKPLELMAGGEVAIASAYNGRVYAAMMRGQAPLRFMWDGQLLNLAGLVIVKGTRNPVAARAYLRHATQSSVMAALAPLTAYGPARTSAAKSIDAVMMNMLPTSHWYQKRSLAVDVRWWAAHGDAVRKRFDAWITH